VVSSDLTVFNNPYAATYNLDTNRIGNYGMHARRKGVAYI